MALTIPVTVPEVTHSNDVSSTSAGQSALNSSRGYQFGDITKAVTDLFDQVFDPISKSFGQHVNQASGQYITNLFNSTEAEKSRQHDEYMTKNAYPWMVEGMQQAGLNPAVYSGNSPSIASGSAAGHSSGNGGAVLASMIGGLAKVAASKITEAGLSARSTAESAQRATEAAQRFQASMARTAMEEKSRYNNFGLRFAQSMQSPTFNPLDMSLGKSFWNR